MVEMVEARGNADEVEQRYDLFSGLLDAAQDEPGSKAAISDNELIGGFSRRDRSAFLDSVLPAFPGNMFIFLFAGHEVGSSLSSCGVAPKPFPTDHSAYTMLFICLVGTLS
jgi:hypothetical protein